MSKDCKCLLFTVVMTIATIVFLPKFSITYSDDSWASRERTCAITVITGRVLTAVSAHEQALTR